MTGPDRWGESGTLSFNQPSQPLDVFFHALDRVFHDGLGVAVETRSPFLWPHLCEPISQVGPSPLQKAQSGLGRHMTGERQPQSEATRVVRTGAREQLQKGPTTLFGDPVDLSRPTTSGP